ncbi:hypothetical protein SAMN05216390_104128 [Lachnospiraceae bacterium KH1T2]|nr:hypothetical protein SAMN05216390_104128 [Lachnospiraceae bacterium KH1T2]
MKKSERRITNEERDTYIFIDTINMLVCITVIIAACISLSEYGPNEVSDTITYVGCAAMCFLNIFRFVRERKVLSVFFLFTFAALAVLIVHHYTGII